MRVVSWNLWWRFGPWEARAPAIVATLGELAADVYCLQEVWADDGERQVDQLTAATGGGAVTSATGEPGAVLGNAIISRHPIVADGIVRLPLADGRPGHRTMVWARIDGPLGLTDVFCTHLAYRFDESALRRRQLTTVAEAIVRRRETAPTDAPPILCGDLNSVPESDEIRALTGAAPPLVEGLVFTDAWAAVGRGPGHTWDDRNPHLARTTWPRRRLDYVLVGSPRPKPLGNPRSARLAGARPIDGVWPSDHLAVVVDLDPNRPTETGDDG